MLRHRAFPERGEIFESLPVVRLDIALVLVAAGVTTFVYWGQHLVELFR